MLSQIVRWRVRPAYAALAAGDPEPAVSAFAPNAQFVFPGEHSFAANCQGRDAIGVWFRRFARLRPRFEVLDVLAAGPPWNMRVTIRFRDHIGDDYQNEGLEFLRMRWGRIDLARVYIDTQAVARWVAEHPQESAA